MKTKVEEVVYRAGYLMPVDTDRGKFNIKRDVILITEGSHFFCQGHLGAVSIEEQSHNPNYCRECLKIIEEERR